MAISPYNRRGTVDSTFYTQANMIRSIEMMLGLDPMNRFDSVAYPMAACFTDTLDPSPYKSTPNNVPLDERVSAGPRMSAADRFWLEKTLSLDWSHPDSADFYWLNRINWYTLFKGRAPTPPARARPPARPRRTTTTERRPSSACRPSGGTATASWPRLIPRGLPLQTWPRSRGHATRRSPSRGRVERPLYAILSHPDPARPLDDEPR